MISHFRFSRSHQSSLRFCPRKAYLQYWADGHGWTTHTLNLEMETGSLIHAMWTGGISAMTGDGDLDFAIEESKRQYIEKLAARGLDSGAELEYEMTRQQALAEGLVRCWFLVRWPSFNERFEVLEIEKEHNIPLVSGVELMFRPDLIVRDKTEGSLHVIEGKSTGYMSQDYLEQWRYSSQTLQQLWAIEQIYGEPGASVIMEFFYKGAKREGNYYSPVVRGYFQTDGVFTPEVKKGKGWSTFDAWLLIGGMKKWIEKYFTPELAMSQLAHIEVYRSIAEMETWQRQTDSQMIMVRAALVTLSYENIDESDKQVIMDLTFAARLDEQCYSNMYRKRCPFLPVCYGQVHDIAESGLYRPREPHHEQEFER